MVPEPHHHLFIAHHITTLQEKVVDLKNRSRRNSIWIIGLPDTVPQSGLTGGDWSGGVLIKVERVYRLGPPRFDQAKADRERPRMVIAKYLDNAEKTALLKVLKHWCH